MASVRIGTEVRGRTTRPVLGQARVSDRSHAIAIGVENGNLGANPGSFTINTRGRSQGRATATSTLGQAEANGIWNEGVIRLGRNGRVATGLGIASTRQNGERTIATGINSTGAGSRILFDTDGRIEGNAEATGQRRVGSFGIIVTDVQADRGNQEIVGTAKSTAVNLAESKGVSIGVSDINEGTTAGNPPRQAATTSGGAEVGKMHTGAGDDVIQGTAEVVIDANDGDRIFFSKASGIVVDGGSVAQMQQLLGTIGKDLTDFTASDVEQINDQLETSILDTGSGNDRLIANTSITATQPGISVDDDLEIIADGVENAGTILLGDGDDSVDAKVSVVSTVRGAKALAQGIDNSSVGILTAMKLGVTNQVLFDMGSGNDVITSEVFASSVDDLAAVDGIGNQAIFVAGLGDDTLNVDAEARLTIEERNDEEQQSVIAHGIENRGQIFLDDPNLPGGGDDVVIATAVAFGDGLQTRAEAIESRGLFDAGAGNDTFILTAEAVTGPDGFADNLTQAAGLQLEQVTAGTFLLGEGDDSVFAQGIAIGSNNLETLAFGITQVTADRTAPGDVGLFDAGEGDDFIEGIADASGEGNNQVEAHGLLFTNALGSAGDDWFEGVANANAGNLATANGIRVGVSNDNVSVNGERLREPLLLEEGQNAIESGLLDVGPDQNTIIGVASATTTSDGTSTLFNDVNGILVDVRSILTAGGGDNTIIGFAETIDQGVGGGAFAFDALNALSADGIEVRGELSTGDGDDFISGEAIGEATNSFMVVDGVDIGLGSTQNGIPVAAIVDLGDGNNQLLGTAVGTATGDEAAVITAGVQSVGTINAGSGNDVIVAESTSTVIGGENGVRGARAEGLQNGLEFGRSITPGTIDLGSGDNLIEARAVATSTDSFAFAAGISQSIGSRISMGDGNDMIIAEAFASSEEASEAFGLFGGVIDTGDGDDQIEARSNSGVLEGGLGLGGGIVITMGAGNDVLTGFGEARVDGGEGEDTLRFEFTRNDFENAGGSIEIVSNGMSFGLDGITMVATNFEIFDFAGETFSADGLFSVA
jgi:hypothetical protein